MNARVQSRFGFLAQRLFNVPLAIHPAKAEILLAVLADRLGIATVRMLDGEAHAPREALDIAREADSDMARAIAPVGYDVLAGVAVIPVQGTLVHRLGTLQPESGMTGYDGIRQNFLTAQADSAVRAIVLDIDSPGGEVAPANLRDVIADVTHFYHWGPRDALALTWTELAEWHRQAQRILRRMQTRER